MVNYFVYNDQKYYSGTIINVFRNNKCTGESTKSEAVFLGYYTVQDKYVLMCKNRLHFVPKNLFYTMIIDVTNEMNEKYVSWADEYNKKHAPKKKTFNDELNVDGMLVAWVWYIIVMLFAVFLNDRIFAWILASIVFFNYRKNKLE